MTRKSIIYQRLDILHFSRHNLILKNDVRCLKGLYKYVIEMTVGSNCWKMKLKYKPYFTNTANKNVNLPCLVCLKIPLYLFVSLNIQHAVCLKNVSKIFTYFIAPVWKVRPSIEIAMYIKFRLKHSPWGRNNVKILVGLKKKFTAALN